MYSPTPVIEIHLAHDVDLDDELSPGFEIRPLRSPYSPKFPSPMAYTDSDADDFRPVHLLPPPTSASLSPVLPRSASPPADKKGLDQSRFNELLQSSRERSTKFGHARKDSAELRRQATLKAHTAKALERRAIFLNKIARPPSPSATESPATPPESPAIFHFTLPSPGLRSPLSIPTKKKVQPSVAFPSENTPAGGWVEEVDFKARIRTSSIRNGAPLPHSRSHGRRASAHTLPSLDQITARLAKANANATTTTSSPPNDLTPEPVSSIRPPLRLAVHKRSPSSPLVTSPAPVVAADVVEPAVAKAATHINRLPAFLQKRSTSPDSQLIPPPTPSIVISAPTSPVLEVVSAKPPAPSAIIVTRRRYPLLPSSPAQPSISRSASTPRLAFTRSRPATPETRKQKGMDMVEKLRRRCSAPAELPARAKDDHPVLRMQGGF
ncbi:hypothetical protein FRB96_000406 [Tulasnella sp. 330]|nr:hypothetical protein FRB96_000406 [Tulasnella sp. 330]KAG8885351.1 hypothetical protein FRB97_001426 [Tulasnella sp. 331]